MSLRVRCGVVTMAWCGGHCWGMGVTTWRPGTLSGTRFSCTRSNMVGPSQHYMSYMNLWFEIQIIKTNLKTLCHFMIWPIDTTTLDSFTYWQLNVIKQYKSLQSELLSMSIKFTCEVHINLTWFNFLTSVLCEEIACRIVFNRLVVGKSAAIVEWDSHH